MTALYYQLHDMATLCAAIYELEAHYRLCVMSMDGIAHCSDEMEYQVWAYCAGVLSDAQRAYVEWQKVRMN